MPFRFRKSFKIGKGLKINLSKSGVSTTVGGRGASLNFSKRGTRATVGVPGTGLSYSSQVTTPTAPSSPPPKSKTPSQGAGCLNGLFNLISFPFRFLIDSINSVRNTQTRRSSLILFGVTGTICFVCFGALSTLSKYDNSDPEVPLPTELTVPALVSVPISTRTLTLQPTVTNTATSTDIPASEYARFAEIRFAKVQEAIVELVRIHQELAGNPSLSQQEDWRRHAELTLSAVIDGATELSGMKNFPPDYAAFHLEVRAIADEGQLLLANYQTVFDNQDVNALNLATTNIGNIIPHMNQASAEMSRLNPTATPRATMTQPPTATLVVVFPTSPPAQGGNAVCTCSYNTYNCSTSDCSSRGAAQACYNYCISVGAGDVHGLDRDGDGSACDNGLN
jgi:hypothetical protein